MSDLSRWISLHQPTWIFFDVGYTLLDETQAWEDQFERLAKVLTAKGRPAEVGSIWRAYHQACRDFAPRQWRAICAAFGRDEAEIAELLTLADDWRHDLEMPHAGARDVLVALAKDHKLGIIANQSRGTRERLRKHGLLEPLSLVIGSAEAGVTKPDPEIFQAALRRAGCEAKDAAMVGDRLDNDVEPANLLGMMTVHVRQGGSGAQRPRRESERATVTVETIAEVAAVFAARSTPTSSS